MKFIFVDDWTNKKSKDTVVSLTWLQLHFERSSFRSVKCFHALKPIFLLLRHTGDSYCLITSFAHKPYLFVAILPLVFANCFPHSTLRQKVTAGFFQLGPRFCFIRTLKYFLGIVPYKRKNVFGSWIFLLFSTKWYIHCILKSQSNDGTCRMNC